MTQLTPQLSRRRFVLVAVWLPLVATLVSLVWQIALLPTLPDPVAIHWGASGQPNGFAPAWVNLVMTVAIGFGLPAVLAATTLRPLRRGEQGVTFRFLGVVASWLSVLINALMVGTTIGQSGLDDARDAPTILVPLIVAALLATAICVLAWFIQPAVNMPARADQQVQPVKLAPGEQAAWMRETSMPRIFVIPMVILTLVLLVAAVWALVATDLGAGLAFFVAPVVLVAALLTSTVFYVRVNTEGFTVRSLVGWPRFHVALRDVAGVETRAIYPMGDFGGWGVRWRPNAWGVVLREGTGIVVTRTNGKQLMVTVDDAETGAAVLAALAAKRA